MTTTTPHYQAPDWFTRNVFNRLVAAATRAGISVWGSRILEVKGRTSGEPRRTPVNMLTFGGSRY
ncbi:MAG: nitroreductase family deazaflavin-dependent oxidoreductase, partial [Gaiellaceae bacterium]